MWGGRFSKPLDERALRYTTSLPVDRRLFEWDVLGSIAHARMLGHAGIIPAADVGALSYISCIDTPRKGDIVIL